MLRWFEPFFSNLGLKFISLLVAVVLWFVVMGSRSDEITKEIPIELVTPQDLIVSNELPDRVSFRLSGPKAFIRNMANKKEEPIRVNLSSSRQGLVTYRFLSDQIELPIGVKVLSINPTAIIAKLEPVRKKEVNIKLVTKNSPLDGIRVSKLELLKTSIRIKGPESRIEQITELQTTPFDLSSVKESGERELMVDLSRVPGVSLEGETPKLFVEIEATNSNFKIRNTVVKVLTSGRRYKADPKDVTIYVRCSADELKSLEKNTVFAVADLRNKPAGNFEVPLSVELPSAVKLIKVTPPKVKVTLE